jgi:hypothetical protein
MLGLCAVFSLQALAGFPQSVYICALVYASYGVVRAMALRGVKLKFRRVPLSGALLGLALCAGILGGLVAAVYVLPMWELTKISERSTGVPFEWASAFKYWPRSALNFLIPYANGDISDRSFKGSGLFWEEYGYVGFLTLTFAVVGVIRGRREAHVRFFAIAAVLAFIMVLGPATPLYRIAFNWLPGMKMFRFPTRFLVVVDLGICVLGGLGLSGVLAWLTKRLEGTRVPSLPLYVGAAVLGISATDLVYHQMRQNAIVDAYSWLEPPTTATFLQKEAAGYRVYSPFHQLAHTGVNAESKGWLETSRYFALRDLIEPNANLFWGVATGDCYAGLAPSWYNYVWGGQNSQGLLLPLHSVKDSRSLTLKPGFLRLMRANSVKYILATLDIEADGVSRVPVDSPVPIYEVSGVLPRAFVVSRAYGFSDERSAAERMVAKKWDPADSVVLRDAPEELTPPIEKGSVAPSNQWSASFLQDQASEKVLAVESERPGFLVLNDTFYPGWQAEVDGVEVPIYRANITNKAIQIPAGAHRVAFHFRSKIVRLGFGVTMSAVAMIMAAGIFLWMKRSTPTAPRS